MAWCRSICINCQSYSRTVVRECCKDDDQSQWDGKIWPPATPKPLNWSSPVFAQVIALWTSTTLQNFIQIGWWDWGVSFLRMCDFAHRNVNSAIFFVSSNRLQPRRPHRFWYKIRQKTRFRARMCLLGVAKPKFKLQTPFYLPRKLVRTKLVRNRVHFGRDLRNFARKTALTLDMLACKRSLVVIVAP